MDFLASPPDVQLDWSAMLMRLDHDQSDFSQSPNSFLDEAPTISVHEPNRFERGRPPAHQYQPVVGVGLGVQQNATAMREMVFRMAAMQPVHIDPESVRPPKRRNVRISKDPQSAAARRRRERISERIRILQRLVPGGTKMDTASMLDEAVQYLKFLKGQVRMMERAGFPSGTFSSCSGKIDQLFDYDLGNNPMHLLT